MLKFLEKENTKLVHFCVGFFQFCVDYVLHSTTASKRWLQCKYKTLSLWNGSSLFQSASSSLRCSGCWSDYAGIGESRSLFHDSQRRSKIDSLVDLRVAFSNWPCWISSRSIVSVLSVWLGYAKWYSHVLLVRQIWPHSIWMQRCALFVSHKLTVMRIGVTAKLEEEQKSGKSGLQPFQFLHINILRCNSLAVLLSPYQLFHFTFAENIWRTIYLCKIFHSNTILSAWLMTSSFSVSNTVALIQICMLPSLTVFVGFVTLH